MRWIGVSVVAAVLAFGVPAATGSAASARSKPGVPVAHRSQATDLSARRRIRYRYSHSAYVRPYYSDRPDYYRPYPYQAPVPFFLGFGFAPRW